MARVLRCDEGDFDTVAMECVAPYWAEDTGFLPPLSATEATLIAAQICGLWALGFTIRQIKRGAKLAS